MKKMLIIIAAALITSCTKTKMVYKFVVHYPDKNDTIEVSGTEIGSSRGTFCVYDEKFMNNTLVFSTNADVEFLQSSPQL